MKPNRQTTILHCSYFNIKKGALRHRHSILFKTAKLKKKKRQLFYVRG